MRIRMMRVGGVVVLTLVVASVLSAQVHTFYAIATTSRPSAPGKRSTPLNRMSSVRGAGIRLIPQRTTLSPFRPAPPTG